MIQFLTLLIILNNILQAWGVPLQCPNVTKHRHLSSTISADPSQTQFDDLPQNTGGFSPYQDPVGTYQSTYTSPCPHHLGFNPLTSHFPILDIYYQGFNVVTQKNSNQKFFHIPSPPNVINTNTGIVQAEYGGTSAFIINTTATQNPTSTFSLFSARLACLVTNGESTSNYEGCTVLFVGNKPNRSESVVYEYEYPNQNTSFSFGDGPLVDFGRVVLPKNFAGLTEVFLTLTSVQNGVDEGLVNILLDNVCLTISN